jgi:crotonobetainyl-CoA:carnitine CoA-transferase CaiB-like acyl-CoA transferase
MRYSETQVSYRHAPPVLGIDTDDVLREVLGMDDDARTKLRDGGII